MFSIIERLGEKEECAMISEEELPEGAKVKSLYKALKLLDFFTNQNPERGISELAELSGLLKSSVHNIMSTFEVCGLIEKNPLTNRYGLGLKVLELSNVLSQDDVFSHIIVPYMNELAEATGETVFFATPYGTKVIYRESAFPNHSISVRAIRGVVAPMYCTGIGKAYLAYQSEAFIERVIAEGLAPFTPNTITDSARFRKEMEEIRQRGYAVDNMEHEYGIKCVGVPIRNSGQNLIGSMSITGPSLRFTDRNIKEHAALMLSMAEQIKGRL